MSQNRAEVVDRNLRELLAGWRDVVAPVDPAAAVRPGSSLSGLELLELVESQFQARHLDLEARRLKERGEGFYTIGSAGHEGNAAVAAALRPDDPAFLHYRSGGFFAQRARQLPGQTPIFDVLLGLCAAVDEPIAGGRHKVFGSRPLWIPPQTSTIASHLPKAMGAAFAIGRAYYLERELPVPEDAIVMCSFGDASVNHSTALGALNAALWAAGQYLPMPVLWVCEDNGLGISVNTPKGWIERTWGHRKNMPYLRADGTDLVECFDAAVEAATLCRQRRLPVFLHLEMVRLLGHAGGDPELAYQDMESIKGAEARDPLVRSCRTVLESGVAEAATLLALYDEVGERVARASHEAAQREHHSSAASVMAPLAPVTPAAVASLAREAAPAEVRVRHWQGDERLPERPG